MRAPWFGRRAVTRRFPLVAEDFTDVMIRAALHTVALFFAALALLLSPLLVEAAGAKAIKRKEERPRRAIHIVSYEWGAGGRGLPAILRQITLENKGGLAYKNIRIEAELFSADGVPLGSLRATIGDVLMPGETKTFRNVSFGIMHAALERSSLRVVGADNVEAGPGSVTTPASMVLVKGWKWAGGRYGTEGILSEVTLENRSGVDLKDVEIQVEYLGSNIRRSYTRAVLHGVLPKHSTKTFRNVNVGFRHPDAQREIVTVLDAKRAPVKKRVVREVVERVPVSGVEGGEIGGEAASKTERRRMRLLAKRYRTEPPASAATPSPASSPRPRLHHPPESAHAPAAPSETTLSGDQAAELPASEPPPVEAGPPRAVDTPAPAPRSSLRVAGRGGEAGVEYVEIKRYETEEEPIPDQDIVVKSFSIANTPPYAIGYIKEITLENLSTIAYRKVELNVDIYSRDTNRPLASTKVVIPDVLPPKVERTFRNVRIGFLNTSPEVVVITVADAEVLQ